MEPLQRVGIPWVRHLSQANEFYNKLKVCSESEKKKHELKFILWQNKTHGLERYLIVKKDFTNLFCN